MSIAVLSAHRSKDPNKQVGACVVNSDNKIVGKLETLKPRLIVFG